jgi:hypothetical protein
MSDYSNHEITFVHIPQVPYTSYTRIVIRVGGLYTKISKSIDIDNIMFILH